MTTLSDSDFLCAVDACELETLSHRDHIRLTWLVLQRKPLVSAIELLRRQFAAFAESKGRPMVFHETITWAFTLLINERIQRGLGGNSWMEFLTLNPDLARGKAVLHEYYHAATLDSEFARGTFVLPDKRSPGSPTPSAE